MKPERLYWYMEHLNTPGYAGGPDVPIINVEKEEANLVSSLCTDGLHRLVIDVDYDIRLRALPDDLDHFKVISLAREHEAMVPPILPRCNAVPSATWGHWHLYVDKPMTWGEAVEMVEGLVEIGLVERNYLDFSKRRGMFMVRWGSQRVPPREERATVYPDREPEDTAEGIPPAFLEELQVPYQAPPRIVLDTAAEAPSDFLEELRRAYPASSATRISGPVDESPTEARRRRVRQRLDQPPVGVDPGGCDCPICRRVQEDWPSRRVVDWSPEWTPQPVYRPQTASNLTPTGFTRC